MPRCLLSESEHRFHLRDMDDETFLTISREYYEILHDIDNFCQTVGSQGRNVTETQLAVNHGAYIA